MGNGRRRLAAAMAVLGLLAGCGGGDGAVDNPDPDFAEETVVEVTVEQVLSDPEAWSEVAVVVRGSGYPLGEQGLLVSDDRATLFVAAPVSDIEGLAPGEAVAARGELSRLDAERAEAVRRAVADAPELPSRFEPGDVDVDQPFVKLRVLHGQGEGEPPPPGSL